MLSVLVVQSEQHVIYRLMAGRGGGGRQTKATWNELTKTAVSGSSRPVTLKKGAPGDQVRSSMSAASQLPGRGPTDVNDAPAPAC